MEPTSAFVHRPAPDHPGWHTGDLADPTQFNHVVMGQIIVRPEGNRSARHRMLATKARHSNVHGAVTAAARIDMTLFPTIFEVLGVDAAGAATLDFHSQLVGSGRMSRRCDAVCEVMNETGRPVVLRGTVDQADSFIASFVGTIREPSRQ